MISRAVPVVPEPRGGRNAEGPARISGARQNFTRVANCPPTERPPCRRTPVGEAGQELRTAHMTARRTRPPVADQRRLSGDLRWMPSPTPHRGPAPECEPRAARTESAWLKSGRRRVVEFHRWLILSGDWQTTLLEGRMRESRIATQPRGRERRTSARSSSARSLNAVRCQLASTDTDRRRVSDAEASSGGAEIPLGHAARPAWRLDGRPVRRRRFRSWPGERGELIEGRGMTAEHVHGKVPAQGNAEIR